MTEQIEMPDEFVAPKGPGDQLRLAREKMGLSVAQLADRTRIPRSKIEMIEAGNFAALPGRAYAVGFARTLARETGLDEEAIVGAVRAELGNQPSDQGQVRETYDPSDPSRVPSGKLVWFSALAGLILLAGLFMAARVLFAPAAQLPSLVEQERQAALAEAEAASAAPDPMGEVVLTARGTVWVRMTTGDGLRLMEGEMTEGQRFAVPADAVGPRVTVGRPDLLAISIGGREVPPLSAGTTTVSNVPIDAVSLLARGQELSDPAATGAPPAAGAGSAGVRPAAVRRQAAQAGGAESASAQAAAPGAASSSAPAPAAAPSSPPSSPPSSTGPTAAVPAGADGE